MAPVIGGGGMDDTPPGSPTTPIAPFQAQYGQQHQQLQQQLLQQRNPSSNRVVHSQSSVEQSQRQATASPTTAAPGADTSIASISSTHSYSSVTSSHGYNSSIIDGALSIVSTSILNNAVNQSMMDAGGMDSNNSFSGKQGIITRGIANNLSGTSPTRSPSLQQDRVPSNANTSPSNSGVITRPPMSSQRNRDNASNRGNSGQSGAALANTSFSSIGSVEGNGAAVAMNNSGAILPNTIAKVAAHEDPDQALQHSEALSTAIESGPQPVTTVSAQETSTSVAAAPITPHRAITHRNQALAEPPIASSSNHQNHRHQHCNNAQSHTPSSSYGQSHNHQRHGSSTHGVHTSSASKKHRRKGDTNNKDAPRPSTTVPPAPAPAMHWTRAKVHGQIPPKDLRAQTVNLVGESIYVFGGCDAKNCFNTLYIFDADTMHWSQPKTFGSIPPPCRAHTSTLVDNKRLYIFGGGDGPQYFNELYMLDTDTLTWTNPQTTGTRPCRRRAHTTCVYSNHIYVFGGGDGVQALNDTYQLDLITMHWSEVKTIGDIPLSRGYHTSNLIKSQWIIYGGSDGQECFSDVHVLDLDSKEWTKIDINRALPRLSHTSTQVGSYLFVIGGHDGSRYSCDVVMLNLVTWSWETRKIYGIPPADRGYHASLLYDSRLFMFGGYDGQTVFDDIYILDLSTCAYLPQITDFQVQLFLL
ncbi:hypothetical protein BX616_001547 [Lobosporangium transversale]|nr:hypothetical protein BX616_001547 [Lobosporangium transversale]